MNGHWWSTLYQSQVWQGYEWTLVEYIIPVSSVPGLWMDTSGVHYTSLKCDRAMNGHWWSTLYQSHVWQGYERTLVECIIPVSRVTGMQMDTGEEQKLIGSWNEWSDYLRAQVLRSRSCSWLHIPVNVHYYSCLDGQKRGSVALCLK